MPENVRHNSSSVVLPIIKTHQKPIVRILNV